MEIKVKQQGFLGAKRVVAEGMIDDIIVKEDFISPEKGKIMIYFKGEESSGILSMTKYELASLGSSLKSKVNLVKKRKSFKA